MPNSWSLGDFVLALWPRGGLLSALVEVLWFSLRPWATLPANLIACGTHASCLVVTAAKQLLAFDSPVF